MRLLPRKRPPGLPLGETSRIIADDMIFRAGQARDERRFRDAAMLYAEAVRLMPARADLLVQRGHMLKEAGDLDAAEQAYLTAAAAMPDDADLALQLGHLLKSQGRIEQAAEAYRRALALQPGWTNAKREIAALEQSGWRADDAIDRAAAAPGVLLTREQASFAGGDARRIAGRLAPGSPLDALVTHREDIAIRGLGRREPTGWGVLHVLRGVRALRGFCLSAVPIQTIELSLNGQLIYRGGLKGGYALPHERDNPALRKYVFNAWIDLTGFVSGLYLLHYVATDIDGRQLTRSEQIVIAPPLAPSALPDSDNDVPPADPTDPRPLDAQINSRPSMVRAARRALLKEPPRTVLVQRPDVLGDLVVSIPALRRLRKLLPEARIVGMVSPGNVDLARTLDMFDELIVTELSFDPWERRRVVSAEAQEKLAADLARYDFDMAIDLSTSGEARLLMPLSGAPVRVGFTTDQFPGGLTVEVAGAARDPWNGHENVPHTNMAIGLVDWLAAMMLTEPNLLRREDLNPAVLAGVGLAPDARFVVLHAGGRWGFTRWPHFFALAQMLIERTDLHVVVLTTDPAQQSDQPADLAGSDRFQVIDRRLHFDELDALLSYSALFVGDDSGVKHLASLRGAKVIGIQNARNNWSEWGQDNGGTIITRKVPCAGCLIQNYPESDDCGRDFVCITAIAPEEVFDASLALLEGRVV